MSRTATTGRASLRCSSNQGGLQVVSQLVTHFKIREIRRYKGGKDKQDNKEQKTDGVDPDKDEGQHGGGRRYVIGLGFPPFVDYEVAGEKCIMPTTKFRAVISRATVHPEAEITLGAGPPTALERAVQKDPERGREGQRTKQKTQIT